MERTHRFSKPIGVVLALAALIVLLLWMQGILGGGKIKPGEIPYAIKEIKEPYAVDVVRKATYVNSEEAVGTVRAKREVLISPRVMGILLELPVKAGDPVQNGQLLARVDDRDSKSRLEQARSAVREAESEHERASSDYERFQRLRKEQAVSQQQFETAQAAHLAAAARLQRARESLQEAEVSVGYTVIRSPITGFVVEKHMEVGDMASPGMPMLTVQEEGALRLEAAVREGLAGTIQLGGTLKVRIDALNLDLSGVVEEKVPVADPMTRSFLVKVSLPQRPGLRSGMFGRLYLPTGSVTALTVSQKAIQGVGEIQMVWVLSEDRPERRYVRTGLIYDDRVEVLSGLKEGDKVVLVSPKET